MAISAEHLEQLRLLMKEVFREELERYLNLHTIKRKLSSDISAKRRAAAQAMLAKRVARALAEQNDGRRKLNGHAHPRANAEQNNGIGEGEIICVVQGLRGPVIVREGYVRELMEAYPGVMVAQEIDRARIWCDDNPAKRKSNVRKFLTNWIARKQG